MRRIYILWHIIILPIFAIGQSCGLTDTVLINPNSNGSFTLSIADFVNDNLADPAQGLCGIELKFKHTFVEYFELSLTSPAGQTIDLIGPNSGQNGSTFGSTWDITFLPSVEPAMPDSGYLDRWDNEQANDFGVFFLYTGSYYPYSGNLEDFNTGPVNGDWVFDFSNDPSPFNTGAIIFARLIFCDSRGVDCCFGVGGELRAPDLLTCEGDTSLLIDPDPFFTAGLADTAEYDYTYIVARDSLIIDFDTVPDLQSFPGGRYQICGLSYRSSQVDSLSQLLNTVDLDSLQNNLNSFFPLFCGDLSDNCITVQIEAPPDTVFLIEQICQGDSVMVGDSVVFNTGNYLFELESFAGCDSIVDLDLTVINTIVEDIDLTICEGDSVEVGPSVYRIQGSYTDTLMSSLGCDSIVNLDLEVLQPIITDLTALICPGERFEVGDSTFTETGLYQVNLLSARNCDSIVNLDLRVLDLELNIAEPDTITCFNNGIELNANASSPAGLLAFDWLDMEGNSIGSSPILTVNVADTVSLTISRSESGTTCTAIDTVIIQEDRIPPIADAGLDIDISCNFPERTLGGPTTSVGVNYTYDWQTSDGQINGANNTEQITIQTPGTYTLLVTNSDNGCESQDEIVIGLDTALPIADAGPDTLLTCGVTEITLGGPGTSTGAEFLYYWLDSNGDTIPASNTSTFAINQAGTYTLRVTDDSNGCTSTAPVEVNQDVTLPQVIVAPPSLLNCEQLEQTLDATGSDQGPNFDLLWKASNGGNIAADQGTATPLVDATGTYELVITNLTTACKDSFSLVVQDTINTISAAIEIPGLLTCDAPSTSLDVAASTSVGTDIQYIWSTDTGGFTGDTIGASVTVNVAATYTLVVLDTFTRCSASTTVEVSQDVGLPVAEAGNGAVLNCAVNSLTLDGTGSSIGANVNYLWQGPCITSASDQLQVEIDCPGTYILQVTNTDNSCVNVDSVIITENLIAPNAVIDAPGVLSCRDTELGLSAANSSSTAGINFSWDGPGILGPQDAATIQLNQTGVYEVIVTDQLSQCTDTASVTVMDDIVLPTVDLGPDTSLTCNVSSLILGGGINSTGPNFAYQWRAVEGNITTSMTAPTVTIDEQGIYRLTIENTATGCRDSSTVFVNLIDQVPFVDAGPNLDFLCDTDSLILQGATNVLPENASINWIGPCLESPADSLSIVVSCPGDYIIEIEDVATGCSNTDTMTVRVSSVVPVAIAPDTVFISCETGQAILDASSSSFGTYSWSFEGDPLASTNNLIGVEDAGTYVFTVTNLDGTCSDTEEILVLENCAPQIIVLPPDSLNCIQAMVMLDASGSTQGDNISFLWTGPEVGCISEGEESPIAEVVCPGTYQLVVTNTEVMTADTQFVEVFLDTISPLAIAGNPDTITCTMPNLELSAAGSSVGSIYTYSWTSFNTGAVLSTDLTAVVSEPGSYVLEVRNTQNGCQSQDIVQVFIDENAPQISFGNLLFPCEATEFDLEALVTPIGNNYQYEWTGPGIVSGAQSPTVRINQIGTYELQILDLENGCVDQAQAVVEEQDCVPCLDLQGPDTLAITCVIDQLNIDVEFCDDCDNCQIQWTTIGGNIQGPSNSLDVTVDAAGTYILSVTNDIGFTSTLEVLVQDDSSSPSIDAGPDRFLTCDSTQVLLTPNADTIEASWLFNWIDPNGVSVAASPTLVVTESGIYTLEVEDMITGCITTDQVQVNLQSAPPIAEAGPDQELTCQNNLIVLDGSGSATGNTIIYRWTSNQNASCLQGENTSSPVVTCPGTYFLEVRDTVSGCFSLDSVVVQSSDELPAVIAVPDTNFTCADTLIVLTATLPTPGSFGFEWCELDANGLAVDGSCRSNLDYEVRNPGQYRFRVEDFQSGCINGFVVNVGADTIAPAVNAGPDETLVCTSPGLQLMGMSDTLNTTWSWAALNDSQIDNPNTLDPTIFAPDTFLLTATNTLNQCTATDTVIIFQDENAPIANAGADQIFNCSSQNIQLSGLASSNSGQVNFNWSTTDGNFVSSTSQLNPVVNQPGTYVLTVNDPINQCTSQDVIVVSEDLEAPQVSIEGLDSLSFSCNTSVITLDASSTVGAPGHNLEYNWSSLSAGQLIGDPNDSLIQAEGVGLYRLLVIDTENTCGDTLIFSLTGDFDLPNINLSPVGSIDCLRPEVILDASDGTDSNVSFDWFAADGQALAQDTASITVSSAGTYEVLVTNEENGCQQSATVTVSADTVRPMVNILPPDALDCFNTSITLSGQGSDNALAITSGWSTVDGNFIGPSNGLETAIDAPGTYTLTLTNTRNGCTNADSIEVEALSNPILGTSLIVQPPACAGGAMGSITVDSIAGGTGPFVFSINGNAFGAADQFNDLFPGTYELAIEDANGCTWSESVTVPEQADITVDLGPDLEVLFGEEVLLEAITNASNVAEVIWTPALGDTLPNRLQQLIVPTFSTKYAVTVIDAQGCTASDEIIILVLERKRYFAPTVFYPNGNGINDTYTIYGGNDVQEIRAFQIFDRWGNMVFERENFQPNDPNLGWDGNFNGQPMNAAVYVFFAEIEYIDGRVEMVQGDLTLIR